MDSHANNDDTEAEAIAAQLFGEQVATAEADSADTAAAAVSVARSVSDAATAVALTAAAEACHDKTAAAGSPEGA